MMEKIYAIVLILFATIGGLSLIFATPDYHVIKMCETRGYWQSGQVRIICQVEQPAAPPKPALSLVRGQV
jgi:hypothetical protein